MFCLCWVLALLQVAITLYFEQRAAVFPLLNAVIERAHQIPSEWHRWIVKATLDAQGGLRLVDLIVFKIVVDDTGATFVADRSLLRPRLQRRRIHGLIQLRAQSSIFVVIDASLRISGLGLLPALLSSGVCWIRNWPLGSLLIVFLLIIIIIINFIIVLVLLARDLLLLLILPLCLILISTFISNSSMALLRG